MRAGRPKHGARAGVGLGMLALLGGLLSSVARAEEAACRPVEEAVTKVFHPPTHLTSTATGGRHGSTPHVGELPAERAAHAR